MVNRMRQFIVTMILVSTVQADIFSSTAHLQNLLHLERHLVTTLHEYVERTETKLNEVRRYLNLFYESYQEVLEEKVPVSSGEDEMVGNPLQAFQLIRRLAVDWGFVRNAMQSDDWNPVRKLTNDYKQLMPSRDDLQGAALALIRLQDTYKLNMTEVAKGEILGRAQGTILTARDLLYLGKESFTAGYYAHAIQWLEEALTKAHQEGNRTAGVSEVMAFYTSAVDMHDRLFERTDIDEMVSFFTMQNSDRPKKGEEVSHFFLALSPAMWKPFTSLIKKSWIPEPLSIHPVYNVADYDTFGHPLKGQHSRVAIAAGRQKPKLGPDISVHDEQANYMALCRGERLRTHSEESKLTCRLDNQRHPYFLLQPLRIEERGLNPYVVQFHNLLTESQVDLLKIIAEPRLARSMVQAGKGSEVVSVSRTSQNAWVGPHDHPLMAKVYQLVETVTGLSTDVDNKHAEIVQIANYGMGGHYTPHFDYLLVDKEPEELQYVHPHELESGDRTATLMFYLSDVTRGGATVFPKIGASVWPEKGSAVFWYNLKKNGKEDPMTLHGACPVAVGSKWVANFWIREKGQAFRRRCDLDPNL